MRAEFLPFSRPTIGPEEIAEVVDSLESGWLATGPKVQRFEALLQAQTGAAHAVAMNSGTAALHVALLGLNIAPGDEVITTAMTFASPINMILAVGARPVLCDVDRDSLNLLPDQVARAVTPRTRAIMPLHFAGLPCDLDAIHQIARRHNLKVIEDGAHAIGSTYRGQPIGALSDATAFSFHPIKTVTSGEGGVLCTNDDALAEQARVLRFHGMTKDAWKRYDARGVPHYDIVAPGFKYNMLDLQAAIGIHQMAKLEQFVAQRQALAVRYRAALAGTAGLALPPDGTAPDAHSWSLFVVKVLPEVLGIDRDEFLLGLKARNIGTGVHFRAVHLHPYFARALGYEPGDLPNAEWASERLCSLPLFPLMAPSDVDDVVAAIRDLATTPTTRPPTVG